MTSRYPTDGIFPTTLPQPDGTRIEPRIEPSRDDPHDDPPFIIGSAQDPLFYLEAELDDDEINDLNEVTPDIDFDEAFDRICQRNDYRYKTA